MSPEKAGAQVQKQNRLPSADALLAAIVEDSEDAIVSKTLEGIVTSWNRSAAELFGYSAEEMIGQSITILIPRERLSEEASIIASILRGERISHFETVRRRKDGSLVDLSLTVSPIRDADGRIIGASKIARNISDRRRAEEAVARLAAVVRSSNDAILTKTLEGKITSWNEAAERTFGYSAAEAVGSPVTILFPEDRIREEQDILAKITRGELVSHYPTIRRRKDGSLVDVSVTISPIRDSHGRIIGASNVSRDITEEKRTQDAIRQLNLTLESRVAERTRSLEDSIRELDAFAYTVAHDLRAPLRAVHTFGQMLIEELGPRLQGEEKEYLRQMIDAGARMDTLISDLLAYTRISRQEARLEPVDLELTVDKVLAELRPELAERRAAVQVDRPLPGVLGHSLMLGQAITNLVSNAVKFVPAGTPPQVRIRAESRHGSASGAVRLWIEDNGIGIAAEQQGKLFKVFERLHTREQFPGTGIGLAIVRRAVERMGGRTGVESAFGRGSRFWIELRAQPQQASQGGTS